MQSSDWKKYAIIIIPALFLLYSAPGALDYVFHFPDEKHYTDAALQMIEKGDYFTPYKPDGTFRFLKPISTYWAVIVGFKMFGVSPFSARVFFWLAGALLVAVTYKMAKSILHNHRIATVAAFIVAANPLVLMSASRAIPDILLTLFLTIAAWGFLEILTRDNKPKRFYWMAYVGTALAFETKGIPAVAFAGASMLFLLFNPWKRVKLKNLLEPYSIMVSLVVAFGWFAVMFATHGHGFFNSFFADQVGGRVSSKSVQTIKNIFLGILNLIAFLIPWIIIGFSKPRELRKYIATNSKTTLSVFGYILVWIVLIIIMSGAVFKFYDRYLLPVIPLMAILLSAILVETETRFKKPVFFIFVALNIVFLTINILYAVFIYPNTIQIVGIVLVAAILSAWRFGVFDKAGHPLLIANGILLLYFNAFVFLYPLLMPNLGQQIVENIRVHNISKSDKIYVYGNIRTAANIRVQSHGEFEVIGMDTVYALPEAPRHFLVFEEVDAEKLDLGDYSVFLGSEGWKRVPVKRFPAFLQKTVLDLKKNGKKYFIAQPK